jgi:hypothetical protein
VLRRAGVAPATIAALFALRGFVAFDAARVFICVIAASRERIVALLTLLAGIEALAPPIAIRSFDGILPGTGAAVDLDCFRTGLRNKVR